MIHELGFMRNADFVLQPLEFSVQIFRLMASTHLATLLMVLIIKICYVNFVTHD